MMSKIVLLCALLVGCSALNLFGGARQGSRVANKGKVIVFGGNGFVGSRVTRSLLDQGCQVVSISKSGSAPKWGDFEGVEFVKGDPTDPEDAKVSDRFILKSCYFSRWL